MCNVETNYSYANWFTHFFLEDCVNQNKLHTQWNGVNWFIIIAFSEFRHTISLRPFVLNEPPLLS